MSKVSDFLIIYSNEEIIRVRNLLLSKVAFNPVYNSQKFGTDVERTIEGFFGQSAQAYAFKADPMNETTEYDFIKFGLKIESKTISGKKYIPREDFIAIVNVKNASRACLQDADVYVFCRVDNEMSQCIIVGFMSVDEFYDKSTYHEKDTYLDGLGTLERGPARRVEISQLHPISHIQAYSRKFRRDNAPKAIRQRRNAFNDAFACLADFRGMLEAK